MTNSPNLPDGSINCRYASIQSQCEGQIKKFRGQWGLLSYARGGTLILSIVFVICGLTQIAAMSQPWFWLSGISFVSFIVIAAYQTNVEIALELTRLRLRSAKRSLARKQRRWDLLPNSTVKAPDGFANVANDLDLFGNESLYQWLGTVYTPNGIQTLTRWIAEGANSDTVKKRQEAVENLKGHDDWRDQFALDCEYLGASSTGPAAFSSWSEGTAYLPSRAWLLGLARFQSVAVLLSCLLVLFGLVPKEYGIPAVAILVVINFFISVFFAGRIHEIFNSIASKKKEIDVYQKLFGDVRDFQATADELKTLQNEMVNSQTGAIHRLKFLGGLVWLANLRRNGILFLGYLFLQFFFCWDIHVLSLLERWQKRNGQYVRNWFEALGQWECLVALAKVASDQPDWIFPNVVIQKRDAIRIEATGLGHPLLPDNQRISNDSELGPPGTVLLVTGSNMSGKSTLLRSIGVNVVLAQLGSVVSAKTMTCPPLRIETSMRIHDDLASGVSFFMAELKRLKQVVDIAANSDADRPLMFLLDEILQGTNSAERHIAVTQVVQALISSGAIGAISTHDLALADDESLGKLCKTVHFREHFFERDGKEVMEFDYIMRQGVSPTTNALKLLKLVGLKIDS